MITWRGQSCSLRHKPESNTSICAHCTSDVFNHRLYHDLRSAATKSSVELVYSRPSSDLYASTRAGCPWCSSISHTIRVVAEDINFRNSEDDDADQEFDQFPITSLCCEAVAKITVWFQKRQCRTAFDSVDIQIEVTETRGEACTLPEIAGDDSILLKFALSSNDRESQLFQKYWGRLSADSNDWLAPALDWLRLCNKHDNCKTTGTFFPSRLIDVTDACRPRLIDRREALAGNVHFYLTLSYVWGRAQTYVLKSANLRHLRQGLDTALLPETLKDAINVTSQLGFNYIWIDAFCIIQDSDDDKAAELPQMPQIYQKSALTIFAASAASSERGFLNPPEVDGSYPPVEIRLDDGSSHGSSFLLGLTSTLAPLKDPIYDRAWTLQEQLLSPRLLLFENGGVSWECVECHITYQGAAARTEAHLLSLCRAADRRSDDSIYFRWAQIRGRYCYKNLTFFEDKLNALSAVASEISRATGWTYLAGLWKEHLLDDLLWCYRNRKDYWEVDPSEYPILKSAKARAAEHVAPSWSWASVAEGGIPDTGMGQERQWSEFKVLDCRIEPAGGGRFGSIKFGVLEVNGRVVELGFRFDFRPDMMSDGDIALIDEAKGTATDSVVGYGVTDPLDEPLAPDIGLHCLGVAKGVVFKRQVVEGLMLLPKGDGSFYRVGYFRAHQPRIFEHVPQRLLRII